MSLSVRTRGYFNACFDKIKEDLMQTFIQGFMHALIEENFSVYFDTRGLNACFDTRGFNACFDTREF